MKYLMDNVHGSITLHDHEVNIIDHMLFQRLRYIKQNDILYLTFMGATHTRFSHSLGVMHMGSKVYDMLFPMEMHYSDSDSLSASLYLRRVLRMALLLHDTGHAAFSHLIEHLPIFKEVVYSQPIDKLLWGDVEDSALKNTAVNGASDIVAHEHYSIRSAYQILRENGHTENEIWDVLSLMDAFPSDEMSDDFSKASATVIGGLSHSGLMKTSASKNMRYILHFILSSEVDADKLDYLRRDSMHAGVAYGGHDVEGLINSMRLIFDEEGGRFVITVSEAGVASLCDMVDARFKLYSHISNNIGNNGAEVVFEKAMSEVMLLSDNSEKILHRMQTMQGFRFFTDDMVMTMISDHALMDEDSYCYSFVSRKRATHVATFRSHVDNNIDDQVEHIKRKHGADKVSLSVKKIKFSAIDEKYRDLQVRIKSPGTGWGLSPIVQMTSFFDSRESFTQYGCYLV